MTEPFSNLLERLRLQRSLTQQALADAAGISLSPIYLAEAGKRVPSKRLANKLFAALHRRDPISADDVAAFAALTRVPPAVLLNSVSATERAASLPRTLAVMNQLAPKLLAEQGFRNEATRLLNLLLDTDDGDFTYRDIYAEMVSLLGKYSVPVPAPVDGHVAASLASRPLGPPKGAIASPGVTIGHHTSTVYTPTTASQPQPRPTPQRSRRRGA